MVSGGLIVATFQRFIADSCQKVTSNSYLRDYTRYDSAQAIGDHVFARA
jgi:hypothetical protein